MTMILRKSVIIMIIVGMMITGTVMAAGKGEYVKLEEKTVKDLITTIEKSTKGDVAKILLPINKVASKESEADIEITSYDYYNQSLAENKINTKTKTEYDFDKNMYYMEFNSKLNDEKVMSGIFSMQENEMLVYIPELMEQYLYIDSSKSEFMDKVDYAKNLENYSDIQLTDTEKVFLKNSVKKYYNVLIASLPEDAFEIQKNVEMNYNGKVIKCDMVLMDLSGQDIKNIIINFLETIKKDDELFEFVSKKAKVLLDSDESLSIYSDMLTKENLCMYIDNYINYLDSDEQINNSRFIVKDYYKNGEVLQRQFVDPYTDDKYLTVTTIPNEYYGIKYYQDKYEYIWDANILYKPIRKREEVDLNIQIEKDNNITKYFINLGNWQEGPEGIFEIDSKNKTFKGRLWIESQNIGFNIESKFNNKGSVKSLDSIIKANFDENIIKVNLKDSMKENAKLTKLKVNNKKDISSFSQMELMALTQEMMKKAEQKGIDSEKAMSVFGGVMMTIPDMRLLNLTVVYPSIYNICSSFASNRDMIEEMR